MKRHLTQNLLLWKRATTRKPLILKGVRQTGKTHLLTEFGNNHFPKTHIINFEKQASIKKIFEENLDPKQIIDDLRFELNTNIDIKHDLVIFDEIQACPNALTSLKYFCEDMPELALCSAGSLLGLHLNDASFPVGKVDMLHLYPMTFTEFLEGVGDEIAAKFIYDYELNQSISTTIHDRLLERLKQYFITGGLPEIVKEFSHHQDNLYKATEQTRKKQEELINAYFADIAKHSGKVNAMHIDRTWRAVPLQLAGNYDTSTSRFRFRDIMSGISRYRQLVHVIDWLEAAELIIRLPIVARFEQPIKAYTKENLFKLMLFDIGLLGAMSAIDPSSILKYNYGTYKGYFAENYVAQQLITSQPDLYSWQQDRSEVEFLLPHKGAIIPIEVKSSKTIHAKSLKKFIDKYTPPQSIIFSTNPPKQGEHSRVTHLPLYLAEETTRLLQASAP